MRKYLLTAAIAIGLFSCVSNDHRAHDSKKNNSINTEYPMGNFIEPKKLPQSYSLLPEPRIDVLFQRNKEKENLDKKINELPD